jgi:hypothetical protein
MPDLKRAARLRRAREAAGYRRPVDAVEAFGWKRSSYFSHENGTRGISRDRLEVYSSAFRVRGEWLAYGTGPMKRGPNRIRIEGIIVNLSTIELGDEPLGEIELPQGFNGEEFRAFRLRGNGNYPRRDGDVVFMPREHGPPEQYIGRECLVTLDGKTWLIRTLYQSSHSGLFILVSEAPLPPLIDVEIVEAAPIAITKHGD